MAFKIEHIKNNPKRKETSSTISFLEKELNLFGSLFSNKIKEDFYTELSVLLKAGVNLKEALEIIEQAQKKKYNKATLVSIQTEEINLV